MNAPQETKNKLVIFSIKVPVKVKVKVTMSLTSVSFERVSLVEYTCQIYMKSLSLTVKKLWSRLKLFCHRVIESQTDRQEKKDAPEFHPGGIKREFLIFGRSVDYPVSNQPHPPSPWSLPKLSRDCLMMNLFSKKLEYPSFVHFSLLRSLFWQRSKVMPLKVLASMHVMMPSVINISKVNTFQILP